MGLSAHHLHATPLSVEALYRIDAAEIWSSEQRQRLEVDFAGIPDDRHYGPTRVLRPYESRELAGAEVINDKQLSIVDAQDMRDLAIAMRLPIQDIEDDTGQSVDRFMAGQLAANILVGSPNGLFEGHRLNAIANAGRVLVFGSNEVEGQQPLIRLTEYNMPCSKPVTKLLQSLEELGVRPPFDSAKTRVQFGEAALRRRGWVGSVYSPGVLAVGQAISAFDPLSPPSAE